MVSLFHFAENESNDPETIVFTDEPPETEQSSLFLFED